MHVFEELPKRERIWLQQRISNAQQSRRLFVRLGLFYIGNDGIFSNLGEGKMRFSRVFTLMNFGRSTSAKFSFLDKQSSTPHVACR